MKCSEVDMVVMVVMGTVPVATAAARSGRKLRLDRAGSKHDRHCRNRKASA